MFTPVLPLRMIAFQCLFLLMAVAIEAFILHRWLSISGKKSVEYAASINFLSTAIGWLIFFILQPVLPANLRNQMISVIFFDRWSSDVAIWVVVGALITFFVSFFIKLLGLSQLRIFLGDQNVKEPQEDITPIKFGAPRIRASSSNQGNAVLVANALSYSAISIVLLLRLVVEGSLTLLNP